MRTTTSRLNLARLVALLAVATAAHAQPAASESSSSAPAEVSGASVPAPATTTEERAADRRLRRLVAQTLARTKGLNSTRIIIKAHDGNVTLLGSVLDTNQVALAVETTKRITGVTQVVNALRVVPEGL
ncbi:BON domain-containing protein [Burkholderia arboris]|uniref:BON domain-containing protein n=1 Tax=Burkholderia arboris TaxID=488730 RepID=UPI001CF5D11A|nr:BON domain-containing protein [Burkholderia arboris]MCA8052353.1 BON domain-containing protein [Burkholderia arboris]